MDIHTIVTTELRHPADFWTQGVTIVYRIAKRFDFEAAHQLQNLPPGHKCGRVHGHSYTVEVWFAAIHLDVTGFVTDFANLSPIGDYLDQAADHRTLNDLIAQPTSELIARHLYDWTTTNIDMPDGVHVEKVRVSETGRSWAEYAPEGATA
jgi:6-pyruvoyltetrahydropterin/6-carboxytetrahydropterin synthase